MRTHLPRRRTATRQQRGDRGVNDVKVVAVLVVEDDQLIQAIADRLFQTAVLKQ
jgi:hypothetical protein